MEVGIVKKKLIATIDDAFRNVNLNLKEKLSNLKSNVLNGSIDNEIIDIIKNIIVEENLFLNDCLLHLFKSEYSLYVFYDAQGDKKNLDDILFSLGSFFEGEFPDVEVTVSILPVEDIWILDGKEKWIGTIDISDKNSI